MKIEKIIMGILGISFVIVLLKGKQTTVNLVKATSGAGTGLLKQVQGG